MKIVRGTCYSLATFSSKVNRVMLLNSLYGFLASAFAVEMHKTRMLPYC